MQMSQSDGSSYLQISFDLLFLKCDILSLIRRFSSAKRPEAAHGAQASERGSRSALARRF